MVTVPAVLALVSVVAVLVLALGLVWALFSVVMGFLVSVAEVFVPAAAALARAVLSSRRG